MLTLKNITKDYSVGDMTVRALRGVDLRFRKSEFVAILGHSGCGKTTLLNIIGGLDRYTSGDLMINDKSTKAYKSRDWDAYRNHSVGFVFQTYNLIPHQTVLSNVELALTLSGVSKSERRARAKKVLEQVGLGDQLSKKPNQMSGGQMQRVAIARALVNDPDIILADEPTGALDTETSEQVMDILKEISADKLIIMVTHNSDIAEKYATRVIKLLDGKVTGDSNPYDENVVEPIKSSKLDKKVGAKKPTMSIFTALSLSLNNLMTKKARTILTSFAGSIGIIGIALILALSSGLQAYITRVEEDTLTSYPITIEENTFDLTSMMGTMMGMSAGESEHDLDKIYSNNIMSQMFNMMAQEIEANNLGEFRDFIENGDSDIKKYISDISYNYGTDINVYKADTSDGVVQVNPGQVLNIAGFGDMMSSMPAAAMGGPIMSNNDVWKSLSGNEELLKLQYDVVAGKMPENMNEAVLIVDKNNEVSDYTLYTLGMKDQDDLKNMMEKLDSGDELDNTDEVYTYDEILDLKFKLVVNTDYFVEEDGVWVDKSKDKAYMKSVVEDALEISIVGIIRPSENAAIANEIGTIGYRFELMEHLIGAVNDSEIAKAQLANPDVDIFTGIEFPNDEPEEAPVLTMDELMAYMSTLPQEEQAQMTGYIEQMRQSGATDEQIATTISQGMAAMETSATYSGNLEILGIADLDKPSSISIYPIDFAAKEAITDIISDYNDTVDKENQISYTDYVGLIMSSVTTIINAISYILIAFVSISLVVSSIMIGIITYISVLERTKEIGILRSIGASKRDISRVFNAETIIVGFAAGAIGIAITLLLCILANAIIKNLTGIAGIAVLPVNGAILLVAISVFLTFIAGLIPSRIAARKDPVEALRTE